MRRMHKILVCIHTARAVCVLAGVAKSFMNLQRLEPAWSGSYLPRGCRC